MSCEYLSIQQFAERTRDDATALLEGLIAL
jgi:hypothetical protein